MPLLITVVFETPKRSAHSCISASSSGANRISRRSVFLLLVGLPVLGDNFITSLLPVHYFYHMYGQKSRANSKFLGVDREVRDGYNKKQKGTAAAVSSLYSQLNTQLTARVPPGGQHAFGAKYSAIARTTTTQTATRKNCARRLLPIHITSPLFKIRWGF